MGRPIKKSKMGSQSGAIQVTSYRFVGEVERQSNEDSTANAAYIIRQRSTRKFLVSGVKESDSTAHTEVLKLVDSATGALNEGEFRISVINPLDSSTDNASKLTNRTVVVGGIGANASAGSNKFKYTISDATNPQGGAAIGDEDFDATSVASLGIASVDSI